MHRYSGLIFNFLIVALLFGTSSCGLFKGKSEANTSAATGWSYNDEEYKTPRADYVEQATGPNLVFVEGGTYTMGATQDRVLFDWDNLPRRVTITSFYMDQTEVTNQFYRDYLHWLYYVYVVGEGSNTTASSQSLSYVYRMALPDTLVWLSKMSYNEPMVNLYLRHPAYSDYPVVGVNWYQAVRYCQWRSDRVNEAILMKNGVFTSGVDFKKGAVSDQGINQFSTEGYLTGQYNFAEERQQEGELPVDYTVDAESEGGSRNVRMEDGMLLPDYRLPTEGEWEYAAKAYIGVNYAENIQERKRYPWIGSSARTDGAEDRNTYGMFNANFKRGRGDYMGIAGTLNDGYARPAPVASYMPNDFGIYNLGGNVSEWVQDIYRQLSFEDFDDLNPIRGNFLTVPNAAGEIDPETMRVRTEAISPQNDPKLHKRTNFRKADYRNYLDGDWQSLAGQEVNNTDWNANPDKYSYQDPYSMDTTKKDYKYYETGADKEWDPNKKHYARYENSTDTKKMYNTGNDRNEASSMINDNARVYKGGSWKDRAYFLNPSVRRFLDADLATDYLGFRCVMDRVGSQVPEGGY